MTAKTQSNDPDHKKSLRRSWRGSGPVAKLTVVFAGIVAIATVIYAGVASWQLYEIREGGKDTHRLAEAAQRQANATSQQVNAMQGQLDSMRDQANSMRAQTNTLKGSLDETRKAANAAVIQANASMSQANTAKRSTGIAEEALKSERRASLGVLTATMKELAAGKLIEVEISFQNVGRSSTKSTSITTTTWWSVEQCVEPPPEHPIPGQIPTRTTIPINAIKISHGYTSVPLPQLWFDLIQDDPQRAWAYVFSRAEYSDNGGEHYFTEFYARYNVKLKRFEECGTHNDAN